MVLPMVLLMIFLHPGPQFSGGEIAGMVIGIPAGLIVIFIIAWFAGLNKHWQNRQNNPHYRSMAACCSTCKQRARTVCVRTAPRQQPDPERTAGITASQSQPTVPPPSAPESEPEPNGHEFTKPAPPQYTAAIGFQAVAADLPPPYTEATTPFPTE